ncbi:MAG: DUF885 domain-containing protein [Candidatus Heimdallarchaeota archaeon]|nr:MAG: DUF885 domain-containing protein [Candidatus Heimdallarchaeota archaeon]
MSNDEKFKEIQNELINLVFDYNPALAAYMGKEEYEKKVANGTPENYFAFVEDLSRFRNRINEIDATQLNPENSILYKVCQDTLELFLFFHEQFPLWNREPFGLEDIQRTIFVLLQRKGTTERVAEAVIAQLEQIPRFLEEFRSRFKDVKIPKLWHETSLKMIQSAPQFLGYLEMIFQSSIDDNLKQTLSNAISKANTEIESHTSWIQDLPVDDDEFAWALGQSNFDQMLSLRKLPWDREKILKTGYELLDSLTEQVHQLTSKIDPTKTSDEVIGEINANQPPTFEMVLEHARHEAERAKEFILEHDLVSIPPNDSLVIAETPAYLAPIIPIAMYGVSPYYDPTQPGIYYITRPSSEVSLEQFGFHSYYSLPNIMAHESFPGHHLDLCWNNHVGSPLTVIALFASTLGAETVEGWAHYCEEMMLEQGFHDEIGRDKVKLVILLGQLWRAVRIIVDVELHCKQRTVEDAIQLLVDRAKTEVQTATAEVRRYTTAPGYQLSYLIGKLLIQNLRQEVEVKQGDQFNLKEFHDTITKSGDLPYYLLKELFDV